MYVSWGKGVKGGITKVGQSFRIKINPNLAGVVKSRGRRTPLGLRVERLSGETEGNKKRSK